MRNQSRSVVRILAAALVGAGCAVVPAAIAHANPACGSTITVSTTLTADLLCSGDAIIVGASGVTLDLGGFNIIGSGTGSGVRTQMLVNDVTVTNGGVSGFATEVYVYQSKRAILSSLSVQGGIGVKIQNGNDSKVLSSSVTNASVSVTFSSGVTFDDATLDHAPLSANSSNSLKVTLSDATDGAVNIDQSDNVQLINSTFTRSPIAYGTTSRNILIQNNTIQGAVTGVRIYVTGLNGRILNNTFTGNGIGVRTTVTDIATIAGTNISGNTFTGNDAAGVLFEASTDSSLSTATVSGNTFDGNGFVGGVNDRLGRPVADGAHFATFANAKVTVKNNIALNNASYGIFADPATVIDGGGNTSTGDPNGCSGVIC
ncbi:right-handed parallel beta-helix repeat-containing protein [Dactylosporangium darangshiense]|uniref:Right handed beta helix domain-containing protein n=1 Tax=Dactylosporangium darangshiense TaxID=579108 RepID=A0ABP8D6S6_9ACTN